ncbi:MAG: SpoIIE family protein phosphatase [bacterium]|nr:SpoIIE family protein phosphatase [bacterium]
MGINIKTTSMLLVPLMLLVLFPAGLEADTEKITFDHISLEQGLSQVSVSCILQDNKGFMWFGTQDGLNKYDGYHITVYRPEEGNPNSLSNIRIAALHEDNSGMLWIGTMGGLNRFDPKTETFTRYTHSPKKPDSLGSNLVNTIYEDTAGTLWVGTTGGGLNKFNRVTGTFTRFTAVDGDPAGLRSNSVTAVTGDKNGTLWVGTWKGWVHKLNPGEKRFSVFQVQAPPEIREGDGRQQVQVMYEDGSGRFWVGITGGGLHILDRDTGNITRSYYRKPGERSGLSSNFITSIRETAAGQVWIGTRGGGLNKFNRDTQTFETYLHIPEDPESLNSNFVQAIYEDRSGMLWIGTFSGGINRFKCGKNKFLLYKKDPLDRDGLNANMVRALVLDREDFLWVGTQGGGLNRFHPDRETVTHYTVQPENPESLAGNFVNALHEDKSGTLWIGTDGGGLNKFNRENDTFTRFGHRPGDPHSLSHNSVYVIKDAPGGNLWVGTWGGGLNLFNPASGKFTHWADKRHDPHSDANDWIHTLYRDREGTLWLGTVRGLTRFERETGAFTCYCSDPHSPYSLKHNMVTSIYEDDDGVLWFGTSGGGLNKYEPNLDKFTIYKQKDGLPNNVVYGVLADKSGNLWLSSNKGLTKFNPGEKTFRNYDVSDGLQSNEFNGGAYYKSKNGEMFFGGIRGFNAFFPENVKNNPYIPPMVITGFYIFNKPVPIGKKGESPLQQSITRTEKIELAPGRDFFSFRFAALSYINSAKNQYAYKMEGFDEDWVHVGTQRYASYTNLNPGEYTFHVKGSNNDQVWNDEGTSVKVIVHPTFWETPWAYALYFLLLGAVLFGIRRFELTRERARVKERESELRVQAAEAQAKAIQSEHMRQNHELEEARKLQLSMLPRELPDVPGLDIAVHMETATEVGGDYYDFHIDEDGTLAVAVGDATGHGLKAGTMVAVAKGLFCSEVSHRDIPDFFHKCTHTIKHMRLGNMYMAMSLLNIKDNTLSISSAGMPPLLLYRHNSQTLETVSLKGTPLGAFAGVNYKTREIQLEEGDTIVLLSDGLPELFDKDGEMFGYQRLTELFEEICQNGESPEDIIGLLKRAGEDWLNGKAPDDDITFVVIRVNQSKQSTQSTGGKTNKNE